MQINNTDIQHAFDAFKSGGIILIPSDVCWEVACDATNAEALEKLNKLMDIGLGSATILVDVSGRIPSYVSDVPDIAWDLIDLSDTSLNLILPNA
jgi:L-threonylcarbamoyladenylate synthase